MRLKVGLRKRRPGISELVGSVLAIALTIIAGAAVFGYINGQAATTESQYGSSVGVTVNYLQEQFSVVDIGFVSSTQAVLYIYNYGRIAVSPVQVTIYNATQSLYLTYNATTVASTAPTVCSDPASASNESPLVWNTASDAGMQVGIGSISTLTLTIPSCSSATFIGNATYYAKITGLYGNVVVYNQVAG